MPRLTGRMRFQRFSSSPLLLLLCACPNETPKELQKKAVKTYVTPASDPRVESDNGRLYPAGESPASAEKEDEAVVHPGSGKPDETNGVCRLYAPRLPEPKCCPEDLGFDAEAVRALCGHALYLGESLYGSCGYHFLPGSDKDSLAIRLSSLSEKSLKEAAKEHDQRLQYRMKDESLRSKPVPGHPGILRSRHNGLNWAFLSGWKKVRQVSWPDAACPEEKVPELLRRIQSAKEPASDAERKSLLPVAEPG